ncbi:MAG: radical SAM protein [Candidatus Omnitrophota bacterium]|jgi:MoaA/NifB/PqqE/SkfB family radical SAM enzyme
MDIALILTPSWSLTKPPISLALLSANLRNSGYRAVCFDLNSRFFHNCRQEYKDKWAQEHDFYWKDHTFISAFLRDHKNILEGYIEEILDTGAPVIGFSVYYPNHFMSVAIASLIKARDNKRIIVFGGPQAVPCVGGNEFLKTDCVDAIVLNEGDSTIVELAGIIREKGEIDICPGVIFKQGGRIVNSGEREPVPDLNTLPYADFSDFSLSDYEHPRELPLLSSRGCIWNCLFCTAKLPWQRYRTQSGGRIFKEIQHQLALHPQVDYFSFHDCMINGNIAALRQFCQLVIEAKKREDMPDIKWWCQGIIRPEMNKDLLPRMREAGCVEITYGVESGSQKVIGQMGKRFAVDTAVEVIGDTHDAGIKVTAIFMFGFPGEEKHDFTQTLDFLKKIRHSADKVIPAEAFCIIERHAPLYKQAVQNGLYSDPHPLYWKSRDGRNTYPERFGRFEDFCRTAQSLQIPLDGAYQKNIENKEEFFKEYNDYCHAPKLNICGNLVEKQQGGAVRFEWHLQETCTFGCEYCAKAKNNSRPRQPASLTVREYADFWKYTHEKYGTGSVVMTGGEPLLHPYFLDTCRKISAYHSVTVRTNMSVDWRGLLELDPSRVAVEASFHPAFSDSAAFLDSCLELKRKGFALTIHCLAYPPFIARLPAFMEHCADAGLSAVMTAFWGTHDRMQYPDRYTEEECETLKPYLGTKERICYNLRGESPCGKLCNAGFKSAYIGSDGVITRCNYAPEELLGNMRGRTIELFSEPRPCNQEFCPMNNFDTVNLS